MDSLTQIVLGAGVGELVLGRKVGNKAILWGAIAGTIPDLDVLSRIFFDDLRANEVHRGVTHSILFSLVMAPVLGHWLTRHRASLLAMFTALVGLVFFFGAEATTARWAIAIAALVIMGLILWKGKKANDATAKEWSWLFCWALVTHPLLDCHTTWGTQLFWPLPLKVAYNNIFVVDPAYTLPFLFCLSIVLFLKRTDPKRRWITAIGLGMSTAYMVLTLGFKWIAYSHITASLHRQGIDYIACSTRPTPFNALLWTTNVECADDYALGYYSILDEKPEVDLVRVPKNHDLLGDLADHPDVHRLIRLCDDNYVIQQHNDTLVFCDLRFGQLGAPSADKPFVYSYRLIRGGDALQVQLIPPPAMSGQRFNALMADLWVRLKGE